MRVTVGGKRFLWIRLEREREIDSCRERQRLRGTAEGKKRDSKEQIFCFQRKIINKKEREKEKEKEQEKEDTWLIFSLRSL
jgi:hypothetical protein